MILTAQCQLGNKHMDDMIKVRLQKIIDLGELHGIINEDGMAFLDRVANKTFSMRDFVFLHMISKYMIDTSQRPCEVPSGESIRAVVEIQSICSEIEAFLRQKNVNGFETCKYLKKFLPMILERVADPEKLKAYREEVNKKATGECLIDKIFKYGNKS